MDPDERSYVQRMWSKDEVNIICATVAFGMGIYLLATSRENFLAALTQQITLYHFSWFWEGVVNSALIMGDRYKQARCAFCDSPFTSQVTWGLSPGIGCCRFLMIINPCDVFNCYWGFGVFILGIMRNKWLTCTIRWFPLDSPFNSQCPYFLSRQRLCI